MGPVRRAILHHHCHAGGMGNFQQVMFNCVVVDGMMRPQIVSLRKPCGSGRRGLASRWKYSVNICTPIWAAISPCMCPPIPSFTTISKGIPAVGIGHPVLVILASSLSGRLIYGEFHGLAVFLWQLSNQNNSLLSDFFRLFNRERLRGARAVPSMRIFCSLKTLCGRSK